MNKTQISTLVVLAGIIAASSVLAFGITTQTALAQGSCSTSSATDFGASSSASGADFVDEESGCTSASGPDEASSSADGERVESEASR